MKMTPAMAEAQKNMLPGVITEEGFLGDDTIPLSDMIARDEGEMAAAGLSYDDTAEKLEYFLREGQRGLGEPVTVDGQWLIRVVDPRGKLPCPFRDGFFQKITAEVTRISTGEKLIVTELSVHLLRAHRFIEGRGSPFRLEPQVLKRVLFD